MVDAESQAALILAPTANPRVFRAEDGSQHTLPEGWSHLAPGDAGLTRRVKALGPSWTIVEIINRYLFCVFCQVCVILELVTQFG